VAASDSITQLGGWEGYEVEASWEERRGARRWYVVRLRSHPRRVHLCSGCGRRCGAVHDSEWRRVRDLPLFEASVELLLPRLRVACRACGPRLERLSWLEPYARVTVRL
jgi:transposase